jgi:hypothetical protein
VVIGLFCREPGASARANRSGWVEEGFSQGSAPAA